MAFFGKTASRTTTGSGGDKNKDGGSKPSTPTKQYANHDAPGGGANNYGPSRGGGVAGKDPFAGGATPYGKSPYYGSQRATSPMPWNGPNQQTPTYTPALNDPRNSGYFYDSPAQAPGGQWDQQQAANSARGKAAIQNDPEAAADLASGDWKAMTKRMQQIGAQGQANKFIQGGGTQQTWDNRFKQAWPTPTMPDGSRATGAPSSAGGPSPQGGGAPPASTAAVPAAAQGGGSGPSPGMLSALAALMQQRSLGQGTASPSPMGGGGMNYGNDPIGPGIDGRVDRGPIGHAATGDGNQGLMGQALGQAFAAPAMPKPTGMLAAAGTQAPMSIFDKIAANRAKAGLPPM